MRVELQNFALRAKTSVPYDTREEAERFAKLQLDRLRKDGWKVVTYSSDRYTLSYGSSYYTINLREKHETNKK